MFNAVQGQEQFWRLANWTAFKLIARGSGMDAPIQSEKLNHHCTFCRICWAGRVKMTKVESGYWFLDTGYWIT